MKTKSELKMSFKNGDELKMAMTSNTKKISEGNVTLHKEAELWNKNYLKKGTSTMKKTIRL